MDKIFAIFLIFALIILGLSEILPIIAIIALIGGIIYVIVKFISIKVKKREEKRKLLSQQQAFLQGLCIYTGSNFVIPDTSNELVDLIKLELNNYITNKNVPTIIANTFHSIKDQLEKLSLNSSSWLSNCALSNTYRINGTSLHREIIESTSEFFIVPGLFQSIDYVSVHISGKFVIFCVYFIIVVDYDNVMFVDWKDFSIGKPSLITVEENEFYSIRGASPIYHRYLHERVDGGPDRRYNYNPSTPVYEYAIMNWKLLSNRKLIISNNSLAKNLWHNLNNFQSKLTESPITSSRGIQDIDVSKDEIASLFKEIISKYGRDIIGKQLFISLLEDYRITKDKEAIKPVIKQLVQQNLVTQLSDSTCTYDTLNEIKEQIKNSAQIDESQIEETLAYLGYGMQLT